MPTRNSRLKRPYDWKLAYSYTAKARADDRKLARKAAKQRDRRRALKLVGAA